MLSLWPKKKQVNLAEYIIKNTIITPATNDPTNTVNDLDFTKEYDDYNKVKNITYVPFEDIITLSCDLRSWKDKHDMWHVYPIKITDKEVAIICPYCGRIHYHKYNEEYTGFICKHLSDDSANGYYIENIDKLIKSY